MRRTTIAINILVGVLAGLAPLDARATFLNFDNGSQNTPVGAFYAGSGVTFVNAQWQNVVLPPFDGIDDHFGASLPYVIDAITTASGFPTEIDEPNSIVAMFAVPVNTVSVRAIDVGIAGARIKAYDALTGGNVLDTDSAFGVGPGTNNPVDLSVSAAGILRVELSQPTPGGGDGTAFDNLEFLPSIAVSVERSTWRAVKALYN